MYPFLNVFYLNFLRIKGYIKTLGDDVIIFLTDFGYKLSKRGKNLVITYPNKKESEHPISDIEALYLAGEGRISY